MTSWAQVAIETSVPWPDEPTTVEYEGRSLELTPGTDTVYPAVAVRLNPREDPNDGMRLLYRFLSALAWTEEHAATVTYRSPGGVRVQFGRGPHMGIRGGFHADFLPHTLTREQSLALALYREGLGAESDFYAVLSFYKVINIRLKDGPPQKDWIRANVHRLDPQHASHLQDLRAGGQDIGEYLYVSCRCAVAHARVAPIADPDDPDDQIRLRKDRELIRGIAALFIETELALKSTKTIIQEHLYELEGFRILFGDEVVARIKAGEQVSPTAFPPLPPLRIQLLGGRCVDAFATLNAAVVDCRDGCVLVRCARQDGRCTVPLVLDFGRERLRFDPREAQVPDDGTADAITVAISVLEMWRTLLCNAAVEVLGADDSRRLARSDTFIAVNVDLRGTLEDIDQELSRLRAEEALRPRGGRPSSSGAQ